MSGTIVVCAVIYWVAEAVKHVFGAAAPWVLGPLLAVLYVGYRTVAIALVGASLIGVTYLAKGFSTGMREPVVFGVVGIAFFFAHPQACLWTVGFIHIGSSEAEVRERERPDAAALLRDWTP